MSPTILVMLGSVLLGLGIMLLLMIGVDIALDLYERIRKLRSRK